MSTRSKNAIIKALLSLRTNENIADTVRVVVNEAETEININLANRKYIGRVLLSWTGEQFNVYLMDKLSGIAFMDERKGSKGAYLKLTTIADARKFIKWYELTAALSAMVRTRSE